MKLHDELCELHDGCVCVWLAGGCDNCGCTCELIARVRADERLKNANA